MKVLFIGTVRFSYKFLEKIISLGEEVVGIVTKRQSTYHSDYADLTEIAKRHAIPCIYPDNVNDKDCLDWCLGKKPDIIFCFGWSEILGQDMLKQAPLGVVGFHPALLPQNRGRHPLVWTLALGLEKTGSTFFFMNKDVDSGDILSQEVVCVKYQDTAAELYEKIIAIALKQIETFIPLLKQSKCRRIPQNYQQATYWRKRGKLDGRIDWRMSSGCIYNLVRALTKPYPGAHFVYLNEEHKVWRVRECIENFPPNIEPGKILAVNNHTKEFTVKSGQGAVVVMEYDMRQMPGVGDYL